MIKIQIQTMLVKIILSSSTCANNISFDIPNQPPEENENIIALQSVESEVFIVLGGINSRGGLHFWLIYFICRY